MTDPIAAVVIPVYNKEKTVARTINSVRVQSVRNIEIVVVNDGSTDNSEERILEAIAGDDRCKYVHQKNSGVAVARTNGVLNHTTAPFVMCIDSDDAIQSGYLERLLPEIISDRSVGIVFTTLWYVKPDGESGLSPWPDGFDPDAQFAGRNQIPTAALTRRTVWERLYGQRQRYAPIGAGAEDADFWLRAISYGFNAKFVGGKQNALFVYSWLSGLVSGNKQYREVDYREWSPWARNYSLMPTGSCATPRMFSHPARQYDQPSVSVIIPVGPGHAEYLRDALDSLDAQTFKKWECIVVFDIPEEEWKELNGSGTLKKIADGWPWARFTTTGADGMTSSDVDVADVIEASLTSKEGKRLVSKLAGLPAGTGAGAGAARNAGLRLARGPLTLFLDADDWLVPTAIERMVGEYRKTGRIIFSDHIAIANIPKDRLKDVKGNVVGYIDRTGEAIINQSIIDYNCKMAIEQPYTDGRQPYVICNITSLIPTKWAREVGGFREDLISWEDVLFWWRLARKGKCFKRIGEPLMVYRYHSGTRREEGLANIPTLLRELKRSIDAEFREGADMGCNCGGKAKQQGTVVVSESAQAGGGNMVVMKLSRGGQLQVSDRELILCEFNPPDKGDKMRHGFHQFNGRFIAYGHFGGGERFYVHKLDVEADGKLAKSQGREPVFIPIQTIVEEPILEDTAPQDIEAPALVEEPVTGYADPPGSVSEPSEGVDGFMGTTGVDGDGVVSEEPSWLAEPEAVTKPELPPRLSPLAELDIKGIRNPDRYIAILIENGLETPYAVVNYDRDNSLTDGIEAFAGIGKKTREAIIKACEDALGY